MALHAAPPNNSVQLADQNKPKLVSSIDPFNANLMFHQDPRRRADALASFVSQDADLDFTLYSDFSQALNDDYERCRLLAIKLIMKLTTKYGDCLVFQKGTYEQVRLEDDAFSKVSKMITDSDVLVRVEAAKSLALFKSVNIEYLCGTLDKKSDVEHCGAFVFGLEDEKKDVRMAALESLSHLSKLESKFAQRAMDHIVDMFNDEIEDIRLKAIQSLQDINAVPLQEDQVEIILSVLDSPTMNIREALYKMLTRVELSSDKALRRCIETVLYSLSRYPQDKLSIFGCFKNLGKKFPNYVRSLVNELLAIHPYLKLPEHSLIEDQYLATLILIFNAASIDPSIVDSLESHTKQHQTYLRHTLPGFMPQSDAPISQTASALFLDGIFSRLGNMLKSDSPQKSKTALMEMSILDLKNFALVEPEFKASTMFFRGVMESILIMSRVVSAPDWMESQSSLKQIHKVMENTFSLLWKYHKLNAIQRCCVQQLRVQALAMELVVFIKSSNASALSLCDRFIEEVKNLENYLSSEPFLDVIAIDDSTNSIIDELGSLDRPKPGTVARKLEPFFSQTPTALTQINDSLVLLIESQNVEDLRKMKLSSATINNLPDNSDTPQKFAAGLVLALTLDATVENVTSVEDVRVKVTYPDMQAHILTPVTDHFRLISRDEHSKTSSYRLYTSVNICHGTWSDASSVGISIILDYRDNQSTAIDLSQIQDQSTPNGECQVIELCDQKQIKVHPHRLRW